MGEINWDKELAGIEGIEGLPQPAPDEPGAAPENWVHKVVKGALETQPEAEWAILLIGKNEDLLFSFVAPGLSWPITVFRVDQFHDWIRNNPRRFMQGPPAE